MFSRKIIVLAAALFAGCLFGQIPCRAQRAQSKVSYAEPKRLILPGDENAEKEMQTGMLLRENFYPIGWSKSGAFAYYIEPPDEGCDCYFARLVILDLRTDKILWQRSYNSENGGANSLRTYWKKSQKEFSRQLARYGIKAQKQFDLQPSPFNYQNDVLTPKLTEKIEIKDIFAEGSVVLQLLSKAKGAKTVYEEKYNPKDYSSFRSAEIAGTLISPFEPRGAIVMVETHRGWEGLPEITQINIVGATLTTDFR